MTQHFISSDNHDIRKALCLSGDEIMVLVQILRLSGRVEYPKMIMSKANLADRLDMSTRRVFEILNTLEDKGYIIRHKDGIVPSTEIRALDESFNGKTSFFIQNDGFAIASGTQMIPKGRAKKEPKPRIPAPKTPDPSPEPEAQQDGDTVQNLHTDCAESAHPPMQNLHTNILIEILSEHLILSSPENSGSDLPEHADNPEPPTPEEGNPQSPAIPSPNPNPELRAAPLPLPPKKGHAAYVPLVEAQDAWLKSRGHGGVKMDGKEGKALKGLIPRMEAQVRVEGDEPTPESLLAYLRWLHRVHGHLPTFEQRAMLDWASMGAQWTKIIESAKEFVKKNPLKARNMEINDTLAFYAETQGDQTANIEAFAKAYGTKENPETWKESYLAAQGRSLMKWPTFSPVTLLRKKADQYRADCESRKSIQKGVKRWLDEDGWMVKYGTADQGRVAK